MCFFAPLVTRTGRTDRCAHRRFGIDRDYATSEFARREQFLEQLQRSEAKNDGRVRQALRDFATR